ncbi:MAG: outer membrane lipoprotein-sorting protein [Myxococcota bacterium]
MTRGLVARTALVLVLSAAPPAATEIDRPSAREVEEAIPEGDALTGRELYDRFLRNKLHTAVQYQRVVSRDPAGNEQRTRFWVRWKDYRDENDDPGPDGVIAKTLVKFEYPFDMRNTAYLLIQRDGGTNEQFLFRPSSGRIRRVKLRGVSVFGTDFSFEDIDFQNIEDSEYHRHPDETIDSIPVYVVEATLKPQVDSEYYKIVVYLEKQHYVPLRTRIWDESSVEIKELIADPSSIQEFDGAWIATRVTMHNLREGTNSTLTVERLDPNPELADRMFGVLRLQIGH